MIGAHAAEGAGGPCLVRRLRIRGRTRQIEGLLRDLRAQGGTAAPDALLPRLRPRHCAQDAGAGHRRTWHSGPHDSDQPGGLLGFRLLLLRCGQHAGRARARAGGGTAVKRSRPDSIVISYQGDGDLSAIGSAEILHAANRGENITVIFVNNAIYSMTGGQVAPTTLLGPEEHDHAAGAQCGQRRLSAARERIAGHARRRRSTSSASASATTSRSRRPRGPFSGRWRTRCTVWASR